MKTAFKSIGIFVLLLCLLLGGAIGGTGIASFYSMKQILIHLAPDGVNTEKMEEWFENANAEDLLRQLEAGKRYPDELKQELKIDEEAFRHLLQKTVDYENQQHKKKRIRIQGLREYLEEVDDGQGGVDYIEAVSFPEKFVEVSNADITAMLKIDWRLIYAYAVLYSLKRADEFVADESDPEQLVPDKQGWLISKRDIDAVFGKVAMSYVFSFDVMDDDRDYYSYDSCISLPHYADISGDPDTTEGRYTYYIPASLFLSAKSGYSTLSYIVDDEQVKGVKELYDKEEFENLPEYFNSLYEYQLFRQIMSYLPGGARLLSQYEQWGYLSLTEGKPVYTGYFDLSFGDYEIPYESTGNEWIYQNGINGTYQNVGEAAVALALSRLNWAYSNDRRMSVGYWDCSSMISRCYRELGVDIKAGATTVDLKNAAKQYHQFLKEEDLRPGDCIWYSHKSGGNHVMMYAGNGYVVHAKSSSHGTVYELLKNTGYKNSNQCDLCFFRPYEGISSTWKPVELPGEGTDEFYRIDGMLFWMGWTYYESGIQGYRAGGYNNGDGGNAYGRFQFDIHYSMDDFMKYCNDRYPQHYAGFQKYIGKKPEYLLEHSHDLYTLWLTYCDTYTEEFNSLQLEFAYIWYWKPEYQNLKRAGIDLNVHSATLRGTAWSVAIRDGNQTTSPFTEAKKSGPMLEEAWIRMIHMNRAEKHNDGGAQYQRWSRDQLNDALAAYKKEQQLRASD